MSTSGGHGGGGSSFPDYTGSGSPESVVPAAVGKSYVDTTHGALYWKASGAGTDTGWVAANAQPFTDNAHAVPGTLLDGQTFNMIGPTGGQAYLTDLAAFLNSGNGFAWNPSQQADGSQVARLILGTNGAFVWEWKPDGTSTAPGTLTVTGQVRATTGIGVGNSAAAAIPGTVVKKIEVFDATGASLGFIAVFDAIT